MHFVIKINFSSWIFDISINFKRAEIYFLNFIAFL